MRSIFKVAILAAGTLEHNTKIKTCFYNILRLFCVRKNPNNRHNMHESNVTEFCQND